MTITPQPPHTPTGHHIPKYTIVETVTTPPDHITEIACLTIYSGTVLEEYETLLHIPTTPTPQTGIAPHMLTVAPQLTDITPDILNRINNSALIAWDLPATTKNLQQLHNPPQTLIRGGSGINTKTLTDTPPPPPNTPALLKARHTLNQLQNNLHKVPTTPYHPIEARAQQPPKHYTRRRPNSPPRTGSLHTVATYTTWPHKPKQPQQLYLDLLDRSLDDHILNSTERNNLKQLAQKLGFTHQQAHQLHLQYYDTFVDTILHNRTLTKQLRTQAHRIAEALKISHDERTLNIVNWNSTSA